MEPRNKSTITVETTVQLPAKKVWEYYTTPEHITQWNFANDDWQCPAATNDIQPGGKYTARMEAKDGSFGFDFEAVYDEIIDGEKFSYTMTDGRRVVTTFTAMGDQTAITIVFEAETANPIDMQRDGWQAILNNFKKYAESKN